MTKHALDLEREAERLQDEALRLRWAELEEWAAADRQRAIEQEQQGRRHLAEQRAQFAALEAELAEQNLQPIIEAASDLLAAVRVAEVSVLDERLALLQDDAVGMLDENGSLSYDELRERARRLLADPSTLPRRRRLFP